MASGGITSSEVFSTSSEYLSLDYARDISDVLVNEYQEYLEGYSIYRFDFESFLEDFFQKNLLDENNIISHKQEGDTIFLQLQDGRELSFTLQDIESFLQTQALGGMSIEEHEAKMQNILDAVESIYQDNTGIFFSGEINSEDVVKTDVFGEELRGKTLKELRELYQAEKETFILATKTQEKSSINRDILRREIELFAGVGDTFEGGARYFSLSTSEINTTVSEIISQMSNKEIFFYIRDLNEKINDNWRKSDMVNQINGKLIEALTEQTFLRLQEQNAPDKDFLTFAKVITGRSIETIKDRNSFREVESSLDSGYAKAELANRALIHIMYRENGVLDTILAQNLDIQHDISRTEIEKYDTPQSIISEAISEIDSLSSEKEYGKSVLIQAGFENLLTSNSSYDELSFEDKISIGAIKRIVNVLKESAPEEKTSELLQKKLGNILMESYTALNESFGDAFDGFYGYFGGKNSEDLGLTGTFGEIFDLYQDINGNAGFFDWSDLNQDRFLNISTAVVLGVGIIVGIIVFSPVIAAGSGATLGMMALAGAKAGLATGIVSVAVSRQGYDTYGEATTDISSQILVDTITGAMFAMAGLSALKYIGNINPSLVVGKEAWVSKAGLIDKGFILGEIGTVGFVVSPLTSQYVRDNFHTSHHDSDIEDFVE